jgi:hypothetical protein
MNNPVGDQIKRVRWAGHVTRTTEMRNAYCLKTLKGRNHFEDIGLDRRIILNLKGKGKVVHVLF